jgi:hypothetical protein
MNKLHAQDSLSNQFFAVVDGGGGVAEASASGDVAVVAVRQLCYVSDSLSIIFSIVFVTKSVCVRLTLLLNKWCLGR